MPQLKVLICGAGVAGNALSFWLSKSDKFAVTVVERFPELRTSGLQIDLRGHGITVMKRMGLEAAVRAKCVAEDGLELVDSKGRQWGYMPANKSGKGAQVFTSEFEIMRGDLCQIFYDRAKESVRYKFGASIASCSGAESGPVQVEFTDGTSETFDLVVGADGLYSRTRRLMLGPETPDALHSLHQYIAYCRVPSEARPDDDYRATAYAATQGRFILTRRHNPHQLQVYLSGSGLTKRLDHVAPGDVAAQKEIFMETFKGAGWKADELVELLKDNDDFYCQQKGVVKLETWSRGHVTLLGDAGYAASTEGYGTSCALVGAYTLAGELVRHVGLDDGGQGVKPALEAYERQLRPFVEQLQRGLEEKDKSGGLEWKAWHLRGLRLVIWAACMMRVYKLAGLFADRGVKGWQLPEYAELGGSDGLAGS